MSLITTLSPSCKLCRREGEKLFLKGDRCNTTKCAIVKRKYAPGPHGIKRQPRLSEYGQQLRAKQKAKRLYGIMERQFTNYYKQAVSHDDSGLHLKRLLEMRLDNVVYRLGFSKSRAQARQAITHGHFLVNGKKLNIPSYQARIGDVIAIRDKSKNILLYKDLAKVLERHGMPSWLTLDMSNLQGKVVSQPAPEDVATTIKDKMIIEFYSRF